MGSGIFQSVQNWPNSVLTEDSGKTHIKFQRNQGTVNAECI